MRRLFGSETGTSAIEFALVAPIIILVFICTGDYSLALFRRMQVTSAAEAGAQYALVNAYDSTQIANAVASASSFSVQASPAPTEFYGCATSSGITPSSAGDFCSNGTASQLYVQVSAQGTYSSLIPFPIVASTYTLTASETVRVK